MFAESSDVPWLAIVTAVGVAAGAILVKLTDAVTAIIKARADARVVIAKGEVAARVEEAKHKDEAEAGQIARWRDICESLAAESKALKEQVARQDAHIDELSDRVGRQEARAHVGRAEYADLYADYTILHEMATRACRDAKRAGIETDPVPPKREKWAPQPEGQKVTEGYEKRQQAQTTLSLKAVSEGLLTRPRPSPEPPAPEGGDL
jgi:hypothetical protein